MYSDEFAVGDVVNVPGDMFGMVKFIGSVRGKQGRFLGVELDGDFAARGKNNGDVDRINYFNTNIPGAGIFLPVHRAQLRFSPSAGMQDTTDSPITPSAGTYKPKRSPGTPSVPKFAQTIGPDSVADNPMRSPSRLTRPNDELVELQTQLANKDKQLSDQAAQLLEMEAALKEIQTLLPSSSPKSSPHTGSRRTSRNDEDLNDVPSLKRAMREKNDKISTLVSEFDAHRADFRSTIETLEMASDETVRMYEARMSELMSEIGDLREHHSAQEDVEAIAGQLKMLEELVAELEDGLEDARRGEAEARGEVEFLRGEVERGRSELRREREKATTGNGIDGGAPAGRDHIRELEMKDDEIRGLKAILHSVESQHDLDPSDAVHTRKNSASVYSADINDEVKRLQASLTRLELQNADLESQLRVANEHGSPNPQAPAPLRTHGRPSDAAREYVEAQAAAANGKVVDSPDVGKQTSQTRCEGCDRPGHDLLHCPIFGRAGTNGERHADAGKDEAQDKWCALCEQDGHLAFDCPNEQY
ncbi:hypothetical protein ANO11243_007400 [Dothideomycetidae sp. 11243]|nr:hypothetical protein ANO11243_007400 [fungal sp. No.11243]